MRKTEQNGKSNNGETVFRRQVYCAGWGKLAGALWYNRSWCDETLDETLIKSLRSCMPTQHTLAWRTPTFQTAFQQHVFCWSIQNLASSFLLRVFISPRLFAEFVGEASRKSTIMPANSSCHVTRQEKVTWHFFCGCVFSERAENEPHEHAWIPPQLVFFAHLLFENRQMIDFQMVRSPVTSELAAFSLTSFLKIDYWSIFK